MCARLPVYRPAVGVVDDDPLWTPDGKQFAAVLVDELRSLAARCERVRSGREFGDRFAGRFETNALALERVVERDRYFAGELEEAAVVEGAKRARQ